VSGMQTHHYISNGEEQRGDPQIPGEKGTTVDLYEKEEGKGLVRRKSKEGGEAGVVKEKKTRRDRRQEKRWNPYPDLGGKKIEAEERERRTLTGEKKKMEVMKKGGLLSYLADLGIFRGGVWENAT